MRYNKAGTHVVTAGMDRKVLLWDIRKSKKPMGIFEQDGVVRSADFLNGDQHVISSTLDGSIMIHSLDGTLASHSRILGEKSEMEGNTCYCVLPYGEGTQVITTHEDELTRESKFDPEAGSLEQTFEYHGHTNTIRYIGMEPGENRFVTACEDQSL